MSMRHRKAGPASRSQWFRLALISGLGALAACGDSGTTPDPPPAVVGQVVVEPSTFAIQFGESVQLSATVRDQAGQLMAGQPVTWATNDPAVATVTAGGLLTGTGGGEVTITATAGARSASVTGSVQAFRLEENALVVDSTELRLVSDAEEQAAGTYRFEFVGQGPQPVIESGDVIVGAQGLGFLRSVISASTTGAVITLETESATLGDLIADGTFAFEVDLFEGGQAFGVAPGVPYGPLDVRYGAVVPLTPLPTGISVSGLGFDFSGFDVCGFFKDDPTNACPPILTEFKVPSGGFDFSPSFDFGSTWDDDVLIDFRGIATGTLTSELSVALGAKLKTSITRKAKILEVGRLIYLQVGAVPVVVHLELEILATFQASATLKGRIEGGLEVSHSVDVGARWDAQQGWQGVLDATGSFNPIQPSISDGTAVASITLEGKITLAPEINLKFYGVAGPLLGVGPWAKANMTASTTTCGFDSSAGLDAKVGIALADFVESVGGLNFSKTETLAELPGASFDCPVGDLTVQTTTTGDDQDLDGYDIEIDGVLAGQAAATDEQSFGNVRLGSRDIGLSGVADNCSVVGANPVTVDIQIGTTAQAPFQVECVGGGTGATGDLEVSVSSTGHPVDADGYQVSVNGQSKLIDSNGSTVFAALTPGTYTIALGAMETNCDVTNGNPVQLDVVADAQVQHHFTVHCIGGELAVSTSTSGPFPTAQSLGYSIDGVDQGPIGPNAMSRSH